MKYWLPLPLTHFDDLDRGMIFIIILFKKGEIFQRETFITFFGIYHYNRMTLKMPLPRNNILNMVDKKLNDSDDTIEERHENNTD